MADSDIRNIFGTAITVAYIQALPYSQNTARYMCEGIAQGFDLDETDGDTISTYFQTEGHPESATVFGDAPYSTYLTEVKGIMSSYLPNLDTRGIELLSIAAQAMLFAYTINTAIEIFAFKKLIGKVLQAVAVKVINSAVFQSTKVGTENVVVTPFYSSTILDPFLEHDYSSVISTLSTYPKTVESTLTNYNWFDVATILKGPDLQIMKDVENQYYRISGILKYESMVGAADPCVEDTVTISTWSGDSTYSYIRNTPCRNADSYIGPVDYVKFNRIFNDGPPSSGRFTDAITGFYIENDKLVLETGDYQTNSHDLFTTDGTTLISQAFIDANGAYDLLNGEYSKVPLTYECEAPYQRMHIGDNKSRYICDKDCACVLQSATGFKYVSLEIPDESWSDKLQFRQTNPLSELPRIRKRAWNVNDNPYISTDVGGVLYPYFKDDAPLFTEHWYVGYPVLNGINELPQLGFFQTFKNDTFNENYTSLVLYPTIASSAGNQGENAESSRSYQMSPEYVFSGVTRANPLNFNTSISSNLSKKDEITHKFFGMGTAFSGKFVINLTQEENAGFFYTGFNVISGGQIINVNALEDAYTGKIIGKYKTIKSISGFKRLSDGTVFSLVNKFATGISGRYFTYAYFEQDSIPVAIQEDNWSYFAPVPTVFDNDGYEKMYEDNTVESYFPRFYDGPFSSETRTFLYPNADHADKTYIGKYHGIPKFVRFRLTTREETVRELFCRYDIYPDGSIPPPTYVPVIRSDVMDNRKYNPTMTHLFRPNDGNALNDYNFNLWGTGASAAFDTAASLGDWVDSNWAPPSGDFVPSGRNSNTYKDNNYLASNIFKMGIKKTLNSNAHQTHVKVGVGGSRITGYSANPRNDGLFHAYTATSSTGILRYILPIFDLKTNSIVISQEVQDAFLDGLGVNIARYNGHEEYGAPGEDSLFFEYVGGRKGSSLAAQEGGYHSQGLVGDRWNGVFKTHISAGYNGYGIDNIRCKNRGQTEYIDHFFRCPESDNRLVLFNTDASGSDLWINGMAFNPFITRRKITTLTSTTQIPYTSENGNGYLSTSQSGDFVNFNLASLIGIKARTGSAINDQWFFNSGLSIGPVDRDIEVGIINGQELLSCSELYINDEQLSHYFQKESDCDRQFAVEISRGRSIKTNAPAYYARNDGYSIITVIPSGQKMTINIFSSLNSDGDPEIAADDLCLSNIGISGSVVLSMKTHVPLDANLYDPYIHIGEEKWLSSKYFIDNNIPYKYRINHDTLEGLVGTHEFITYSTTGKLYPKPTGADETAFKLLATYDDFKNPTYGSNATPEAYWRNYAMKNNRVVSFSGYREGSRISFEISDLSIDYDIPPYQSYKLVVPSGRCIISGSMGYYGQADNCVFSEGVHLINGTQNDTFADIYNPEYVSDTLKIISGIGLFTYPTGYSANLSKPVLVAPSVMKQRENSLVIAEGQKYSYLLKAPPYNYNKLWWPALSDLETLNPGETIESIPPGDGNTFDASTMLFSASQGQLLPNGNKNPNISKEYYVQDIFQIYDSVATDSLINSGKCITSGRGTSVTLSQGRMSGALVALGTPLTFISKGLI